ncbi:hypothetical protein ABKV19_008738, partial [Rosa sericea]
MDAMDYSSDEESDISESEISDYKDKPYEQLRSGKLKVKGPNGTLRCPFCAGKKKQDYKYKDLLQHASGVAKGSANRSAVQKANHLALALYLEKELASEADQNQRPAPPKPVAKEEKPEDLYVWPWTGVVANILLSQPMEGKELLDSGYWLRKFSKCKPVEVHTFYNEEEQAAGAVVFFSKDWNGFRSATEFENTFISDCHGKEHWHALKQQPGSNIYGWCARSDDYDSQGTVGEFLRKTRKLRTLPDIVLEAAQSTSNQG